MPDLDKIEQLNKKLDNLIKEEAKYVITNEYEMILKRHGCTGLNAGTYFDKTHYVTNLPSNKLELWAFLESSRFVDPVFREMYKERKVIQEERRVVIENQPIGKLIEELLALAFKNHPYRIRQMGPMSNIDNWTRKDVESYFHSNYTASNMVIGIAGDITPEQVKKVATKYFSKIRTGQRNPRILTKEPDQIGEKRMTLFEDSQPWLVIGYHCPSVLHKDFIKFSVLDYLLTRGRSSRLNKKLVIKEKSALFVGSAPGFPGSKYPSLYVVFALPNTGHPTEKLEKSIISELKKLKNELVTEDELKSAITRFSIDRIRQMLNYGGFYGMLSILLEAEMIRGSWKKAFEDLERVESITAKDIQEMVKKYLTLNNRTILKIEKKKEGK
jgi:predicted Zn-dependent peptidase